MTCCAPSEKRAFNKSPLGATLPDERAPAHRETEYRQGQLAYSVADPDHGLVPIVDKDRVIVDVNIGVLRVIRDRVEVELWPNPIANRNVTVVSDGCDVMPADRVFVGRAYRSAGAGAEHPTHCRS